MSGELMPLKRVGFREQCSEVQAAGGRGAEIELATYDRMC